MSFFSSSRLFCTQALAMISMLLVPFTVMAVDLDVPTITTLSVADLDAVKAQMSAAHGIEWRDEIEETKNIVLQGLGNVEISFKRVFSKSGAPFIELIEATPAIGPWQATANTPSIYYGYRVNNIHKHKAKLLSAGFHKVAKSQGEFVIYEGLAGTRIALMRSDLAPSEAEAYTPTVTYNLGLPYRIGYSVHPTLRIALKKQWRKATGLSWLEDGFFESVPYFFTEASGAAVAGIYALDTSTVTSAETLNSAADAPCRFVLESTPFNLPACDCNPCSNPCGFEPWNATPFRSLNHPCAWAVDGSLVNGVISQWEGAGLVKMMSLDIGIGHPIVTYYRGIGGIYFELVDLSFN